MGEGSFMRGAQLNRSVALVVVVAGVALIAAGAGWLYSRQALFRLSNIQIEAESPDLRDLVRDKMMGHLGRSLFSISLSEVEETVASLPRVREVQIHRRWPDSLVLSIEERRPVALAFGAEGLEILDLEGRTVEAMKRARALPLIKGMKARSPEEREALLWLSHLQDSVEEGSLGFSDIEELRWIRQSGLRVSSRTLGLEVDLGKKEFARAWARANKAYALLRKRGVDPGFLDAAYPRSVIAKTRGELQNSQSDLNLDELGRRTREVGTGAR